MVIEDRVNPRPVQMISFSDSATSIRKDTEIWLFGEHVFLKVLTPGKSGGFGCRHVQFQILVPEIKTELYKKHSKQFKS